MKLTVFCLFFQNVEDHVAFVITVPTALAIFLAVFVLVCIESIFKKLLRIFSLVIWACLVAMGYLFMFSGGIVCPWDQVRHRCFFVCVGWVEGGRGYVLNFAYITLSPLLSGDLVVLREKTLQHQLEFGILVRMWVESLTGSCQKLQNIGPFVSLLGTLYPINVVF